jgi:hypothetical protein
MAPPRFTEASTHARELLSQACRALDAIALGDAQKLDDAFRGAIATAATGRELLKPTPVVAPKAEVDAALRREGCA